MALVGPKGWVSAARGAWRWALCDVAAFAATAAVAAGVLGDDLRWLGGVALGEAVITRALWWSGALRGCPWARLGLRLAAAVVALHVLGIAMPDAWVVGSVFLATAVGCLAWLGVLRVVGLRSGQDRELEATMAVAAAVGFWFALVGLPPSGWSAIVALLAGATAVGTSRVVGGPA